MTPTEIENAIRAMGLIATAKGHRVRIVRTLEKLPNGTSRARDVTDVHVLESGFAFQLMQSAPTPGGSDVWFESDVWSDVEAVIRNWYFGSPIEIDGWTIPIHRHPEWSLEPLRKCVETAGTMASTDWLEEEARMSSKGQAFYQRIMAGELVSWSEMMSGAYCCVTRVDNSVRPTLRIRRDLSAAYIVDAPENVGSYLASMPRKVSR